MPSFFAGCPVLFIPSARTHARCKVKGAAFAGGALQGSVFLLVLYDGDMHVVELLLLDGRGRVH